MNEYDIFYMSSFDEFQKEINRLQKQIRKGEDHLQISQTKEQNLSKEREQWMNDIIGKFNTITIKCSQYQKDIKERVL